MRESSSAESGFPEEENLRDPGVCAMAMAISFSGFPCKRIRRTLRHDESLRHGSQRDGRGRSKSAGWHTRSRQRCPCCKDSTLIQGSCVATFAGGKSRERDTLQPVFFQIRIEGRTLKPATPCRLRTPGGISRPEYKEKAADRLPGRISRRLPRTTWREPHLLRHRTWPQSPAHSCSCRIAACGPGP